MSNQVPENDDTDLDLTDLPNPLDKDLPCIRCEYNLRGLDPAGKCPECGASIRKALAFALQEVLCLACMRPNHPSSACCIHCSAPISGAAATGAYWQTQPFGVAAKSQPRQPNDPARPSRSGSILLWLFCAPLAIFFATGALQIATGHFGDLRISTCLFAIALVLLGLPVLSTIQYRRRMSAYLEKVPPHAVESPSDDADSDEWESSHEEENGFTEPP